MLISFHRWISISANADECDECGLKRIAPVNWLPDLFIYTEFGSRYSTYEETQCIFREK